MFLINLAYFGGGLAVATIVWYLVLRNNKKKFAEWMATTEGYFTNALSKIENLGDDAGAKIEEILDNFRNVKK